MGHSIQRVRDRFEIFHDLDLVSLVGLLLEEVHRRPHDYPHTERIVEAWVAELPKAGPGTIELELDTVVAAEGRIAEFEKLITPVRERVVGYGKTVPASVLNSACHMPGVVFEDLGSEVLLSAVDGFRDLIQSGSKEIEELRDVTIQRNRNTP
jgi:hypothetical protein